MEWNDDVCLFVKNWIGRFVAIFFRIHGRAEVEVEVEILFFMIGR